MNIKELKTIGNQEWCAFNELNIPAIRARVDSGAKTSSIQAIDIKLIKKDKKTWVRFTVLPIQKNDIIKVVCEAELIDKRSIKGSVGIAEDRLIIKTPITIGDDTFEIEVSLAKRNGMGFRMLLGREAIAGRYLINSEEKHLQKKYLRKEINALYKLQNNL